MKVAVLGGSGFLGSHVCDQLSEAGHKVRIFDCVKSPWLRPDQEMVLGDLLDETTLKSGLDGCDVVYNFAAIANLDEALNKPIETVKVNVLGNVMALDVCHKAGIQHYIYASTVYVHSRYGGFYRCSKQSSEHYIEEYHKVYGLDYTILRYGSIYGPRSDENNGLWRVVKYAIDAGKLRTEGNTEAMREYIHVGDAALASVRALTDESFKNQHVVLTGQEPMLVQDMLKMLAEILGLPKTSAEFVDSEHAGHYIRTPYAYHTKLGRKYVLPMHVDLGQGLLQLINEIQNPEQESSNNGI
jgi:UDP-glucose 4-epimerase